MSAFDKAASRLHPDACSSAATPPPAQQELPRVGDRLAVAGLVKGSSGEVLCRVAAIRRAKDKGEAKAARGDKIYELAVDGGDTRKTRLLHLAWRVAARAAASPPPAKPTKAKKRARAAPDFLEALRRGGRIVAPMVGGSELAFRLLCRRHGATAAYTPMMEATRFVEDAAFRAQYLQTHAEDRPLVAHFCGNDPGVVGRACALAAATGGVDAVDLNLGCPQRVAFAGHYGSYLMREEDRDLVKSIVAAMRRSVPREIAVCVKIRLMDDFPATLKLVEDLRDAGAQVVAIHGRKRATWHRKGPGARDGPADLDSIARVVRAVGDSVVVVSNGNVRDRGDVDAGLATTGAAGVMSAEGLLDDPALFSGAALSDDAAEDLRKLKLAADYLDLVDAHGNPAGYRSVAFHCRRVAKRPLEAYDALDDLLDAGDAAGARRVLDRCARFARGDEAYVADPARRANAKSRAAKRLETRAARKRFEERMIRKAKREGKALDFYVKQGADAPTKADLDAYRAMADEAARLAAWNAKHKQHCLTFHLGKCPRGDACAFIHDKMDDDDVLHG